MAKRELYLHSPSLSLWLQVMASERVMVLAEGVLVIAGVRLSDSGIYSCNSSNSLGTTEADSVIMLRVYCESEANEALMWLPLLTSHWPCWDGISRN